MTTSTINLSPVAGLLMSSGLGDGKTTACVVAQERILWLSSLGKPIGSPSDDLKCACPVLRRLAIYLNDRNSFWSSDQERSDSLRFVLGNLMNTRGSHELIQRRVLRCVDFAARSAIVALRSANQNDHADALEKFLPIESTEILADFRSAAAAAADAADAAAGRWSADAAADAARWSDAAAARWSADAARWSAAATAATAAADAAAARWSADAAAARDEIIALWKELRAMSEKA